jgi:hypothetical protein
MTVGDSMIVEEKGRPRRRAQPSAKIALADGLSCILRAAHGSNAHPERIANRPQQ